jgi:hypothetical protein
VKSIPTNTLRTQLAQSQKPDLHPDADQLTAFAENTLLDRERHGILEHLAVCPSCRATLQASTAAELEPAFLPQQQPVHTPFRTWFPGLAVATAVLAIAGSASLLYHATRTDTPTTQTAATARPLPPPASDAPASTPNPRQPASSTPAPHPKRAPHPQTPEPTPEPELAAAPVPLLAPPSPATTAGTSTRITLGDVARSATPAPAQAEVEPELTESRHSMLAAKASPGPATPGIVEQKSGDQAFHAMGALMAAPALRPHFRINDSGRIERSTETGIWQPVPIDDSAKFRVLSVSGAEIWAGGDHLRLFHSTDGGITWIEVQPPTTADRNHAIVHIRIEPQQKITVESDDSNTWTSTDNGATWQ